MDKSMKTDTFISFAQKAAKKLEEKKKQRRENLFIPDFDEIITITALTDTEIMEINEYSDDPSLNDSYMIYTSCPELQELAKTLVEQKSIEKHVDVVNIFSFADKKHIAHRILEISGIYEESKIEVISETAEIKNF